MITEKIYLLKSNRYYSIWEYIIRVFVISFYAYISFNIFQNKTNPLNSFIWSSITFLLLTIFSALILMRSRKWVLFFTVAYLVKLFVGLFHYLYFIDPTYFIGTGDNIILHSEYQATFSQLITFAHDKIQHGIFYYNSDNAFVGHPELWSFISIPFVFFGDFVLNIAPVNSFFSILISINIILISLKISRYNSKSIKYIAVLTAYFPLTLISSLFYRDIVGLSLMSVGILLVIFSKKSIFQYLMLVIAAYLFYLQRTVYPIPLFFAFIINTIINSNFKSYRIELFYKVSSLVFAVLLIPLIINLSNTEANENYATGILNFNPLILPLKILVGFIGPFPWTQFLQYKTISANAYQLQDYFQGVFNLTFVVCTIGYWKRYFNKNNFNLLNMTGLILIISGLFNSYMHMTYVAIGFIFIIPSLISVVGFRKFINVYMYSFIILVTLNILVVYFIGNLGLSSFWK